MEKPPRRPAPLHGIPGRFHHCGPRESLPGPPQPASDYSENQDGTQSYAYLTAQALGADISVLARSGIGAYHGWDGGNPALPPMYESISYYRDKTAPWAFSRQADIVVINLGTNDLWTGGSSSALTQAMQDFMRQVRRKNPRAAIVWAAGGIMADYLDEAADAVNRLGGAAKNYYVCPPALRTQQGRQRPSHRRTASLHGRQPGRLSAAKPPGLRLLTLCRLPLCLQPLPLPLAAGAFFVFLHRIG
ncbi:MAG: GDSL-type esterase/lipase family protein [Oscillospiraceae bacterium]